MDKEIILDYSDEDEYQIISRELTKHYNKLQQIKKYQETKSRKCRKHKKQQKKKRSICKKCQQLKCKKFENNIQ